MKLRFFTYGILIVIAVITLRRPRAIEVRLASTQDYVGIQPIPGDSWLVTTDYIASQGTRSPIEIPPLDGQTDAWVKSRLGPAQKSTLIPVPVPNRGSLLAIQRKLDAAIPLYQGEVRVDLWTRGERIYQISFARKGDLWVVIDAVSFDNKIIL